MSRRVVFDVNILVSAIIAPDGAPARAYLAALEQAWMIGRSGHIVTRLIDVLGRPRFHDRLPNDRLNGFLRAFQGYAEPFTPDPTVTGVADDEEDDRVLGTAVAAGVDYLVTGDAGLLRIGEYRGVRIVTAREFLILIDAS
jgi:putative PIN family toxin of toxin-antitoxin system